MTQPALKLEAFIIWPNGDSDYRFLVDGHDTKYISVDADALPCKHLVRFPCHPRVPARIALPPLPPGAWDRARVVRCPVTGKPVFGTTSLESVRVPASNKLLWHTTVVAHADLTWAGRMRQNLGLVRFGGRAVVYKFAPFPWMRGDIERETRAYRRISEVREHSTRRRFWAPRFLGHVVEEDGAIAGFLMEDVRGRAAEGKEDERMCRRALRRMHQAGLVHGGALGKADFVVRTRGEGDEAVMVDFSRMRKAQSPKEMEDELGELKTSFRSRETHSSRQPLTGSDDGWDHICISPGGHVSIQ